MQKNRHFVVLLVMFLLTTCKAVQDIAVPSPVIEPIILTLSVHYLTDEKTYPRKRVIQAIKRSNDLLRPYSIGVVLWREDRKYLISENVLTEQDRIRLADESFPDGTLHVYVSDSLHLIPNRPLNGIQITTPHTGFVVLSSISRDTTLAHEIGHYLGLDHVTSLDNIMCSKRDDDATFNREQGEIMRINAIARR
jgi:hypothetical protein